MRRAFAMRGRPKDIRSPSAVRSRCQALSGLQFHSNSSARVDWDPRLIRPARRGAGTPFASPNGLAVAYSS